MMRARRVLLDDEDPGAHAADRELLVTLGRDPVDLDPVDPRARRTVAQECRELVNRRRAPSA